MQIKEAALNVLQNNNACCAVFDIDNTLLCLGPGTVQEIYQKQCSANLPPNEDIKELHNKLQELGIITVVITARGEDLREATMLNLERIGVCPDFVFFRSKRQPPGIYKQLARKNLARQGYCVLLNIGDKDTDFQGGYYAYGFKVNS